MFIQEFLNDTKSDELVHLRAFFSQDYPLFQVFEIPFVQNVILDAQAVLKDIRWKVSGRNSSTARSAIDESIDAGTLIAHAPKYLEDEILRKIPEISKRDNISDSLMFSHWFELRAKINFHECGDQDYSFHDHKDAPYVKLQIATGYPIFSQDSDFALMGAESLSSNNSKYLRTYSREAAKEYKVKFLGTNTYVISHGMFVELINLTKAMSMRFSKAPPAIKLLIGGFIVWSIVNNRSRHWLEEKFSGIKDASVSIASFILEVSHYHYESKAKALNAKNDFFNNGAEI